MAEIADGFANAWREFTVPGVPASGPHDPIKSDIRAVGALIEQALSGAVAGIVYYATGAERVADTANQPVGKIGKAADEPDYYRREGDGWVIDNSVYEGVASVVAPFTEAVQENLDGLVPIAIEVSLGKYAQAYSNVTPADPRTFVAQFSVGSGEAIYLTSVQPAGDEYAAVVWLAGDGTYLSNVGQGAAESVMHSDARFVPPANAAFGRATGRAGTIINVKRQGAANALADRLSVAEAALATVDTSATPVLGYYVQAYTGAVISNAASKYIRARVRPGQRLRIQAEWPNSEYGVAFSKDGAFVSTGSQGPGNVAIEIVVPDNVNEVGVSGSIFAPLLLRVAGAMASVADRLRFAEAAASPWRGTDIAWFGTSIPATPNPGLGAAYPELIGEAIGATIYNEAIGSSPVRFGHASNRTSGDPYGIAGQHWMNVLYALGSTLAEKNDLIANWAAYRAMLSGDPPATLDDNPATRMYAPTGTEFIRDCSFERKLARHLPPTATRDLIVLDHGYNDLHGANADSDIDTAGLGTRDRGTFLGGVNFLIDYILAANPRQTIKFAEHYESQLNPKVAAAQRIAAGFWSLPILPLADELGWSQQQVTISGEAKTLLQQACPDNVHPHTDVTGWSTARIARQHAVNLARVA